MILVNNAVKGQNVTFFHLQTPKCMAEVPIKLKQLNFQGALSKTFPLKTLPTLISTTLHREFVLLPRYKLTPAMM